MVTKSLANSSLSSKNFKETGTPVTPLEVPGTLRRVDPVGLPNFSLESLKNFLPKLGEQNVSPDDNVILLVLAQ